MGGGPSPYEGSYARMDRNRRIFLPSVDIDGGLAQPVALRRRGTEPPRNPRGEE